MGKSKIRGPRLPPIPRVSLHHQQVSLRHYYQGRFRYTRIGATGIWDGSIRPIRGAPTYTIQIRYRVGRLPQVFVLHPPLADNAPHLWSDRSLCLYWHAEWEWRSDRLLALSIVPWTADWLGYYELWKDTGRWLGPSSHDHNGSDRLLTAL